MAFRLIYAVNNAFKPLDELFIFPPRFLVNNPTLDNFFDLICFNGQFLGSAVPLYCEYACYYTCGNAGHILLASAAAYPLAKLISGLSIIFFNIVVLSLMFSRHVLRPSRTI